MTWDWLTLGDVLVTQPNGRLVQQGWSPKCHDYPAEVGAWGVLKATAVQPGQFRPEHNKALPSHLDPRPSISVRPGDLLLTCAGPRSRCGVPALVRASPDRLLMSGKMYRFRPDDRLLPAFLEMWLLSPIAQQAIDGMKTGISDSGLNLTHARFTKLAVPVPPLEEQRRIVEILEGHLSRLDAGKKQLEVAALRGRSLTKSVLLHLIPETGQYPTTWKRSDVQSAGSVQLGRQRHPDWHVGSNMKAYLRVANVHEDRIDVSDVMEMHWPDDSFERFRLHPGDILLNEGQTPELLGRPAMYRGEPTEVAFTNSLLRFRANPDLLPAFALLVFRRHMHAGRFARESRITTNIAHLSASRLKPIEFPVPPMDEQTSIVRRARDLLEAGSRIAGAGVAASARGRALRRGLLAAAFRGQLTGRDSDLERAEELIGA